MKSYHHIWQNIRKGENLDLYATIIIFFTFVILKAFKVNVDEYISSIILGVLSLFAISSIKNRDMIRTLAEGYGTHTDQVLLEEYPVHLNKHMASASDIFLSGTNLGRTIHTLYPLLVERIKSGSNLRVLIVTPNSLALEFCTKRSYIPMTTQQHNFTLEKTLTTVGKLWEIDNRLVHVNTIDFPLAFGFFALDLDTLDGEIYIEHYTYKDDENDLPKMFLTQKDLRWFNFYKKQIGILWDDGTPYDFD